jgi:hypothetical protein
MAAASAADMRVAASTAMAAMADTVVFFVEDIERRQTHV